LTRTWGPTLKCLFVLLNPSTADVLQDDATVRKCFGFASRWGFGSFEIQNLFAYRNRNPSTLAELDYGFAVGPKTNSYLAAALYNKNVCRVVLGWGSAKCRAHVDRRVQEFQLMLRAHELSIEVEVGHIGDLLLDGQPRHPLMPSYNEPFVRYDLNGAWPLAFPHQRKKRERKNRTTVYDHMMAPDEELT
jgi:hypothetical protein